MNLNFFKSVPVTKDTKEVMEALEQVLQQEHGNDGKHRIASKSQSGFASTDHIQKIEEMWNWFQQQKNK